jgi:hypothetical protein
MTVKTKKVYDSFVGNRLEVTKAMNDHSEWFVDGVTNTGSLNEYVVFYHEEYPEFIRSCESL